jgi:hypothetical protein
MPTSAEFAPDTKRPLAGIVDLGRYPIDRLMQTDGAALREYIATG